MTGKNGKKVLVGVTSWGHGCANPNFPGFVDFSILISLISINIF
jgi:hypothetical protein